MTLYLLLSQTSKKYVIVISNKIKSENTAIVISFLTNVSHFILHFCRQVITSPLKPQLLLRIQKRHKLPSFVIVIKIVPTTVLIVVGDQKVSFKGFRMCFCLYLN